MKPKKFKLKDLNVKSFVTLVEKAEMPTIFGAEEDYASGRGGRKVRCLFDIIFKPIGPRRPNLPQPKPLFPPPKVHPESLNPNDGYRCTPLFEELHSQLMSCPAAKICWNGL